MRHRRAFLIWAAVVLILSVAGWAFFYFDMDYSTVAAGETEGVRIPVLMYHSVSEKPLELAELSVRPSELEKQVKYLCENGFTTITFEDLPDIDDMEKPVMLTFDDGYADNYTDLFPILKKYGAKATVFVIPRLIGKKGQMTAAQIKEMSDSGLVSIQSHSYSHKHLLFASEEDIEYEFSAAVGFIESITGRPVIALAYPNGECNDTILNAASKYYDYAVVKRKGYFTPDSPVCNIRRIRISRSTTLWRFARLVSLAGRD